MVLARKKCSTSITFYLGNFTAGLRRKENVGFYTCRLLENAFPKARKVIYSKFLGAFTSFLHEP